MNKNVNEKQYGTTGKNFCDIVLKKEIENIANTKVLGVNVPKEWAKSKKIEDFPKTGETVVKFIDDRVAMVEWEIDLSVEHHGENGWEFMVEFDYIHLIFKDGEKVLKLYNNLWDAVGIPEKRYHELETKLLGVFLSEDSKTGIIDRMLEEVKNDKERRAFEVIMLNQIQDSFPMKMMERMGMGKVVSGGDLADILKKIPSCDNPDCPIHGGKQTQEKKTGKKSGEFDPMVA